VDNGSSPDFAQGSKQLTDWVTAHRTALLAHPVATPIPEGNLNVPTCPDGTVRGPVHTPQATSLTGIDLGTVNCSSTATGPANDAQAFVEGFAVISPLATG